MNGPTLDELELSDLRRIIQDLKAENAELRRQIAILTGATVVLDNPLPLNSDGT